MVWFFDHRASTYEGVSTEKIKDGKARRVTTSEHTQPSLEPTFRCWVKEVDFRKRLSDRNWERNWLISMRDKSNATNERTGMFAIRPYLPSNDTLPSIFVDASPKFTSALVANLSSLCVDFVVRQKVGGLNLAAFIVEQLPILPPSAYSDDGLGFIVPRVLELSYTSHSMAPFAQDLGYDGEPFKWDEDRRAQLRAELDAWYALAYGLSRDELRYVLDPKEVMGEDYPSETFRVLQKNEIKKYGEYRTQRLVLAAYDALVAEGMRPRTEGYR